MTKRSTTRIPAPTSAVTPASASTQPGLKNDHAPLENELLKQLYSNILRCRLVREAATATARTSRSKLKPATGREAIEVGCVIELQPDDTALCPENSTAAPLVLGTPAQELITSFQGKQRPNPDKRRTNSISLPHSADALAIAAGIGYAYRQLGKTNVVLALDAGTVPARALDALSLIGRDRLPVIAVVENLGKDSHPARLLQTARKYKIPVITVDANDAVAVYRVAREAIHRARTGRGGTVIDCYPLPLPGNRPSDGVAAMERYMKRFGIWSDEWKQQLQAQYSAEIDSGA